MVHDPHDPDDMNQSPLSPQQSDEEWAGGNMTKPDRANDALDNAHEVGLYTDTDDDQEKEEGTPQEVSLAEQVNNAERERRGLDQ
jgi:hypothetical protein